MMCGAGGATQAANAVAAAANASRIRNERSIGSVFTTTQ
jgi:hypothetical protein